MKRPAVLVLRHDCRFSRLLREAGCEVINLEVIATRPVTEREELRNKLLAINAYDGVFFTSPVSAKVFVEESAKLDLRFTGRIYALGARAVSELKAGGFEPNTFDRANTATELLSGFGPGEFSKKKFLFLRGDRSLRTVPEKLAEIAIVEEVVVYRTSDVVIDPAIREEISGRLNAGNLNWVCVFSPSAAESFVRQVPAAKNSI